MECRKKRNFKLADEIQNNLEEVGVFINEDAKEWRADGGNWKSRGERKWSFPKEQLKESQ